MIRIALNNKSAFVFASTHDDVAMVLDPANRFGALMAFTVRSGGCSSPPFDSLNFSSKDGDDERTVRQNLAILGAKLAVKPERIVFPKQVHGAAIEILDSIPRHAPTADALITSSPGIFPAVKTADCVPILLLDPVQKVAAAVHAGWKGTVLRIARKAVNLMCEEFGTEPSDIIASLGPGIGQCCYEVDEVVLKPFQQAFPDADRFVVSAEKLKREPSWNEIRQRPLPTRSGKSDSMTYHLDLVAANRSELCCVGVLANNVYSTDLCTACHPELFFSYRRDSGRTGRQLGLVGFRA